MADAVAVRPPEAPPPPKVPLRRSKLLPDFPYPGLRPFRKDEWPVFCGRSAIVDELLSALGATHFVPVLGTSGCGKSSIVKAGLVATLEREHGALGAAWQATEMRPGNSPLWNLTEALWRATHEDRPGNPEEMLRMRALLGRAPGGIERVLREYGFPTDRNLLILVDQFEELFRFGVLGGDEEVQLFTDQLIDVFVGRPEGIHVTLTMRADFIADCARLPRLADALNRTAYLLRWLTEAEMREAITTPARLYRGTVDADLVDRMIRDVGGKQDQLPIIQHALMWMWNRAADSPDPGHLTLADYEGREVGGVEGALSLHADRIYESMAAARPAADAPPRDLRPATQRMFQALSDVDASNRVIRRPCAFGELCAITGCAPDELRYIIDQYRKPGTSFLMPDDVPQLQDNDTIDVSHEALIRQWSKMQGRGADEGWLAEERRDAENWRALAREVRKFRNAKQAGRERYLSGDQNDDLQAWWKQRAPSAAWAARYSTDAKQLFPDVGELLEISAKRARRAALQRRALIAAPAVLVVGIFVTFLGLQGYALEKARTEQQAAQDRQVAAENQLATSMARDAAEDWRVTESLILTQHMLQEGRATPLTEGIGYRALSRQHLLHEWPNADGADWSRDGRFIAVGSKNQGRIVDPVKDITQTVDFSDLGDVQNIAISPDGSKLAASNYDGSKIAIGSPTDPKALRVDVQGSVDFLWFTPDGKWVVASDTHDIIVLDVQNNREAARWPMELAVDMAISDDSKYLATTSFDGHLSVRDFTKLTDPGFETDLVAPSPALSDEDRDRVAGQPAVDASRGLVAVPMVKNRVELIDFINKTRRQIPYAAATAPTSVRFNHQGNELIVGSIDGSIRRIAVDELIGPKAPEAIAETPGELLPGFAGGSAVALLRYAPSDGKLVAVCDDGTALIIDLTTRAVVPVKSMASVLFADFFGSMDDVVTFDSDHTLRLWGSGAHLAPDRFEAMPGWGFGVTASASRAVAVQAVQKGPSLGKLSLNLLYRDDTPSVAAKFDDGIRLYATGEDKPSLIDESRAARLFDANGPAMVTVDDHGSIMARKVDESAWRTIGAVDSASSIRQVLTDGADRVLVVASMDKSGAGVAWHDFHGPGTAALPPHAGDQPVLALSPHAVLLASSDPSVVVLLPIDDVPLGAKAKPVKLPFVDAASAPRNGALSPNGRYAAVLQDNGTVSVWDVGRGVLVSLFGEPDQRLANIAFRPDSTSLDAVGLDGTVYRWPLLDDPQDLNGWIQAAIPDDIPTYVRQQIIKSATSTAPAAQ